AVRSSGQVQPEHVLYVDFLVTPRHSLHFFFLLLPPPPRPTLFPYTTLFRSRSAACRERSSPRAARRRPDRRARVRLPARAVELRSEEHTSELQSRGHLVCRLLLEKKKETTYFVMQPKRMISPSGLPLHHG